MVDEEPVDHVSFVSVVLISNKPRFPTKTTSELFLKKMYKEAAGYILLLIWEFLQDEKGGRTASGQKRKNQSSSLIV
jgi:hypothetical protein